MKNKLVLAMLAAMTLSLTATPVLARPLMNLGDIGETTQSESEANMDAETPALSAKLNSLSVDKTNVEPGDRVTIQVATDNPDVKKATVTFASDNGGEELTAKLYGDDVLSGKLQITDKASGGTYRVTSVELTDEGGSKVILKGSSLISFQQITFTSSGDQNAETAEQVTMREGETKEVSINLQDVEESKVTLSSTNEDVATIQKGSIEDGTMTATITAKGAGDAVISVFNSETNAVLKAYRINVKAVADEVTICVGEKAEIIVTSPTPDVRFSSESGNVDFSSEKIGMAKEGENYIVTSALTFNVTGEYNIFAKDDNDAEIIMIPVSVVEHEWAEAPTIEKEPTCKETGMQNTHCTICNAVKEGSEEEIPMLEHQWGEWEVVSEPTATEEGLKERTCAICGEKEQDKIPATGSDSTGIDESQPGQGSESSSSSEGEDDSASESTDNQAEENAGENQGEESSSESQEENNNNTDGASQDGEQSSDNASQGQDSSVNETPGQSYSEGNNESTTEAETAVKDVSIALISQSGKTMQFAAVITPETATNKAVTWSSSDPTIATIDSNGLLVALKNGTVVITATTVDGGHKATKEITISGFSTSSYSSGTTTGSSYPGSTSTSGSYGTNATSTGTVAGTDRSRLAGSSATSASPSATLSVDNLQDKSKVSEGAKGSVQTQDASDLFSWAMVNAGSIGGIVSLLKKKRWGK